MKKKQRKRTWTGPPAAPRRGPAPDPPDPRWRLRWRTLIVFLVALLLLGMWWFYAELVNERAEEAAVAAAIRAGLSPYEALQSAMDLTGPGRAREFFAAQEGAAWSARVLGFVHAVALPGILPMALYIFIIVHKFWFAEEHGASPRFFIATFSLGLIGLTLALLTWRYGYVPLVNIVWEACGAMMVPHEHFAWPRCRGGCNIMRVPPYRSGEMAAQYLWLGMLAIGYVVAAFKERKSGVP